MKQISSIDLYFLLKELKILENERIDNFYYENDTFYLKVYVKGKGHFFLTNKISKYIYLGAEKAESEHPPNFIQYLRKYFKNGFIREIRQVESERILDIIIEKKIDEQIEEYHIIIELFANGNVIVTDNNYQIKNSLVKQKFKDRSVLVKEKYELPPPKEFSLFNLDENKFKKKLLESDLSIVKFLAINTGIGGKYAQEICSLAKIDKNNKSNELNKEEVKKIYDELISIKNKTINPKGTYKNNELIDFIPFDFVSITDEKRKFASFNELIKTYYSQFTKEVDKRELQFVKELDKLKNRLEKQLTQKKEVLEDYEKYKEIGNKIYENYAQVEELLNSINNAAKEKGWEHVLETIKNNPKLNEIVEKVDYKNNEIVLNLN